ncbi:MAG: aminopeptidase P family protein [Candidatus Gorgyraea atricola]|nr:aminopeptidase P family protein [Candidatus Gorgyraea atricola]
MNYINRRRKLIRLLESNSLDSLRIKKRQNITYLTGTRDRGVVFFVSHKKTYLVKNGAIPAHLKRIRSKKGIVESLRILKDSDELRHIKKACKDGCDIMNYAIRCIVPGISERSVKDKVEQYIIKKGKKRADFDIIIASGRNASMPHAVPSSKKIKEGEMVVIDLGAMNYGYNSDLTRTVFLGRIDRKCLRIYNIVLAAQKRAIEKIRPGIKANYIDNISRQYISKKGLGRYFIHGLGHGIGLETHEGPSISKNSNITLKENMVITVEPGIYMTGWGGIRIEDVVLVTKNGCKVLTSDCKKGL